MVDVGAWWSEEDPRRPPAEYACELARARIWQDERRFVVTVADVGEAAPLLQVDEAFAHALVLVLSQLPRSARRPFADEFYARRTGRTGWDAKHDPRRALAVGAAAALRVVELAEDPELESERIVDLLHGAAQGDDLSSTPPRALAEVVTVLARVRMRLGREDASTPRAASAAAVAEVLDPASGLVALKEVLVRASWAAVRSWEPPRVLAFLLDVDRALAGARP